jgi:uncharacterized protein YunC (DUF1805 family)
MQAKDERGIVFCGALGVRSDEERGDIFSAIIPWLVKGETALRGFV